MFKLRKIDKELREEAITKRLENIKFIEKIPRDNLVYSEKENKLTISNHTKNENLTIQYPGKETTGKSPKPWDFRPKLEFEGTYMPDLSFADVWVSLYKIHENLDKKKSEYIMKLIACEFYRMAYLIDYYEITDNDFNIECLQTRTNNKYKSPYKIHVYKPNTYIINELTKVQPDILGFSWESFFAYNDLIALNEDCKYYYKKLSETTADKDPEKEAKKYINGGVGRRNNLFTHIEFIRFMLTEPTFIDMIQKFVNGRGVAPITQTNLNEFLKDFF